MDKHNNNIYNYSLERGPTMPINKFQKENKEEPSFNGSFYSYDKSFQDQVYNFARMGTFNNDNSTVN